MPLEVVLLDVVLLDVVLLDVVLLDVVPVVLVVVLLVVALLVAAGAPPAPPLAVVAEPPADPDVAVAEVAPVAPVEPGALPPAEPPSGAKVDPVAHAARIEMAVTHSAVLLRFTRTPEDRWSQSITPPLRTDDACAARPPAARWTWEAIEFLAVEPRYASME